MPSQLLHVLFGEDVYAEINRRVESRFGSSAWGRSLATHGKAFALGCQGPDIFYHSQGRRPVGLEYGTLLHRRGMGTFTGELCRMSGTDALRAYALGFMTHAILDRYAHPYIVYKADSWRGLQTSRVCNPSPIPYENNVSSCSAAGHVEVKGVEGAHAFFERIIDVLMLKLLRGAEISSWDQEGLLAEPCENPPLGLRELLAEALIAAFPERAGKDEKLPLRIENAFLDSAGFYRMTAPARSTGARAESRDFPLRKRHLVYLYPEELPDGIDFLNMEKRPWYWPSGKEREDRRSFPEIYAGAVAAAADSLTNCIGDGNVIADGNAIADGIGNGGLNITDENGKPCAPCRTDPLPLEEVLEGQAKLRGL